MNDPRFALVILHYLFPDLTEACLESLAANGTSAFKVFLINNSPHDGYARRLLDKMASLGLDHAYLELPDNPGFSGGANAGMRAAMKEGFAHIVLLNNDTRVSSDFAGLVQAAVREHPADVATGLVVDPRTNRPEANVGRISATHLLARLTNSARMREDIVEAASGCFLVIPRTVLEKAGLFEEGYFMYYEDIDLCVRWKQAGILIRFYPEIRILHTTASTANRAGIAKEYYWMRNRTRTVLLRGSPLQKGAYAAHLVLLMAYKLRHPRIFGTFARGIFDALRGKMGKR